MNYTILNKNEIGGENISTSYSRQTLDEAKELLRQLKQKFEAECEDAGFLDCIEVEQDTEIHYEVTDGEDWFEIQILKNL